MINKQNGLACAHSRAVKIDEIKINKYLKFDITKFI